MVYIATVKKENLTGKTELYDNVPKWNYPNAKDDIRVVVFTNCEDVALYLNGKPVIAEPQRDEVTNARYWDIPYAEGELKAVGLNGGKPCAEHALRTYGAASEIRLSSDRGTLDGKNDLAHVEIELFDANGVPALDAKNDLTVSVSGGGRLLAIENAAPSHMDAPRADTARPYRGKLLAYVVATQDSGDIQVSVSGGGLETSALTFKIK